MVHSRRNSDQSPEHPVMPEVHVTSSPTSKDRVRGGGGGGSGIVPGGGGVSPTIMVSPSSPNNLLHPPQPRRVHFMEDRPIDDGRGEGADQQPDG